MCYHANVVNAIQYLHTQAFRTADYLLWDQIYALCTNVTFMSRCCLTQ